MKRYVGMYLIVVVMLLLLSCGGGGGGGGGAAPAERIKSITMSTSGSKMTKAPAGFNYVEKDYRYEVTYTEGNKISSVYAYTLSSNVLFTSWDYTYDTEGKIDNILVTETTTSPIKYAKLQYSYDSEDKITVIQKSECTSAAPTWVNSSYWAYTYTVDGGLDKTTIKLKLQTGETQEFTNLYYQNGQLVKSECSLNLNDDDLDDISDTRSYYTYSSYGLSEIVVKTINPSEVEVNKYVYTYNEDGLPDNVVKYAASVVQGEIYYDYVMEVDADTYGNWFIAFLHHTNPVLPLRF